MGEGRGLRSAIENVVRNALNYSEPNEPVDVALERVNDEVVLTVSDRGPGVPEEDLARIFEPFYRGDPSRDHRNGGQGIGLAITERVMELHGGQVGAENRVGGGLEVTLKLPAATQSSASL